MVQKPKCERKAYSTSISARKALQERGDKPSHGVERCKACTRWHIKEK